MTDVTLHSIPGRSLFSPVRASFAQEGIWFTEKLHPLGALYNLTMGVRIKGTLTISIIEKCLEKIVTRHEALRTNLELMDGVLYQKIGSPYEFHIDEVDLTGTEPDQREQAARELLEKENERPFDLTCDKAIRAHLFKLDKNEYLLGLLLHHSTVDGWSFDVLFDEITRAYRSLSSETMLDLPDLPVQYADFAVWQRECQQKGTFAKQIDFWKGSLAGAEQSLELPYADPGKKVQGYKGALHKIHLPRDLLDALKAISRREKVTLFMTLLASFFVLLHRYTGQHDIVIGCPQAGRGHQELEPLIGMFVNSLPYRAEISGNESYLEFLSRVKRITLECLTHQELPFEVLVNELSPRRAEGRTPFIEIMFQLHKSHSSVEDCSGVTFERYDFGLVRPCFELNIDAIETSDGLVIKLEYPAGMFEKTTIAAMASHWNVLLEGIVNNPGSRIKLLPLLSEDEKRLQLIEWNKTKSEYPEDKCVHEVFEEQVLIAPSATAVIHNAEKVSYDELNRHANRLARFLQSAGVKRGDCVALCIERSVLLVVSEIAVLKAGAAYVPVDPSEATERLSFILKDCGARFMITTSLLPERSIFEGVRVIHGDREETCGFEESNPDGECSSGDAAYVMYTSGSTGKPKGVPMPHRAMNRLVLNTSYISIGPGDAIALASNPGSDAVNFEMWGALLNGAGTVIFDRDVLLTPKLFGKHLREEHITIVFLSTSLFNHYGKENPELFRGINHVLFAGDRADPVAVRKVLLSGPPGRLLNMYGPTENTMFSTWHHVEHLENDAVSVPIGRPISNSTVYILDEYGQPVPMGVKGELYLGGDGVALSYLGRPELTEKAFIPDPFQEKPGACLYRTGDLGRFLPDGTIEFLGRADNQVKIRGSRVEPGEVESVLSLHPDVAEAAVICRDCGSGDKKLIAYVRTKKEKIIGHKDLRAFLMQKLPDYMIPSFFVTLPEFPMTSTGKIHRKALLSRDDKDPERDGEVIIPRAVLELRLIELWERLLNAQSIGIRDNFFDLGGHSLLAVRLIDLVKKELGFELPVTVFFRKPTIEFMAEALRQEGWTSPWTYLVPIRTEGQKPPFFIVSGALNSVVTFHTVARYSLPDQPLYGLQETGEDYSKSSENVITYLARHYLEKIREIQKEGPYHLGGWSFGGTIAYEMAQQLAKHKQDVALLVLFEPSAPFDMFYHYLSYPGNRLSSYLGRIKNLSVKGKMVYTVSKFKEKTLALFEKALNMAIPGKEEISPWGNSLPDDSDDDVFAAYFDALKKYPIQPYHGRVAYFKASDGLAVTVKIWARYVKGKFEVCPVHGKHGNLFCEPHVRVLMEKFNNIIEEVIGL